LFENNYSRLDKINVASFRKDDDNERQIKVLNKIFDIGIDNFECGLNTKKYITLLLHRLNT
jgi:hypothetical protein